MIFKINEIQLPFEVQTTEGKITYCVEEVNYDIEELISEKIPATKYGGHYLCLEENGHFQLVVYFTEELQYPSFIGLIRCVFNANKKILFVSEQKQLLFKSFSYSK